MSNRMAISEAREDFSETVNRVAYGKERVVVHRRGKDLVAVVPIEDLARLEAGDREPDERALALLDEMIRQEDESGDYARMLRSDRPPAP